MRVSKWSQQFVFFYANTTTNQSFIAWFHRRGYFCGSVILSKHWAPFTDILKQFLHLCTQEKVLVISFRYILCTNTNIFLPLIPISWWIMTVECVVSVGSKLYCKLFEQIVWTTCIWDNCLKIFIIKWFIANISILAIWNHTL